MELLIRIAQFILSLSILIVLHELGHFIPAKLFKTRVEKFYLFFDPWFSLFKVKKGETEYGIGWLPLGGYVKISGMIDESMDKEQMKQPAQPWEFRSKPAWQRLIIMIGGVTVNVILGVFILWILLFVVGREYVPLQNLKNGVVVADSSLYDLGFKDEDKIVGLVGTETETLGDINRELMLDNGGTVIVERNGQKQNITIPDGYTEKILAHGKKIYFIEAFPAVIDSFPEESLNKKSGLLKGDQIVGIDTFRTPYYMQLLMVLQRYSAKMADLHILRNGKPQTVRVYVTTDSKIGFINRDLDKLLPVEKETYSFFSALPAAMQRGGDILVGYARQFKILFTKEGAKQISGFAGIAQQYDTSWNWERFWEFTAILSFILAFMNILPIPALDGGHVMFLLYEIITRRKPSEKALEIAQYIGLVIVLGLLLFANGNDIYKALTK